MGVLAKAFEKRASIGATTTPATPADWLIEALGGTASTTGIAITEDTAMRSTAVFACVNKIAKTVASLPLPVYERLQPRGKRRAPGHPLYRVLHDRGNDEMTAMTVRQTIQGHAALRGNGYAEIEYTEGGDVRGLWPLRPDRTRPVRLADGELWYETVIPKTGELIRLPAYRVFHLMGLSNDGLVGYSPIRQAAESIGVNLALTRYGGAFFGNGARPGGIIKIPGSLSDMTEPAKERLRLAWEERHQGLTKAHRIAILDEGMDYVAVGIKPEEAQFMDAMRYTVVDIARLYDMPPHAIQELERSTNNNIEHQGLELVVYTLRPWLVQWEQTILWKLFSDHDRERYFAEHLVDGLLRGDFKSRMEGHRVAKEGGWMSANDVREVENQNPLPPEIGDVYTINGAYIPVQLAGQQFQKPNESGGQANRLQPVFQRLLGESLARALRKEATDVALAARKHLGKGDQTGFRTWLDNYYAEHAGHLERQLYPVMLSYAQAIHGETCAELEHYTRSYVTSYGLRHLNTSINQILQAMSREDPVEAIRLAADTWNEARLEEAARYLAVAASDYFQKFTGVSQAT